MLSVSAFAVGPTSKPAEPPEQTPQRGMPNSRRDWLVILVVWLGYVSLTLLVEPRHGGASTYELLYYTIYDVGVGSLIGFYLFDRFPKDGFIPFALRATLAILGGTLVNESIVGPLALGAEAINGRSVYYGLTDSLSVAGFFVLIRLAQRLKAFQQQLPAGPEARNGSRDDADTGCFFVRVANGTQRIHFPDVIYMAAERDFARIVCINGEHFVSENLKSLLERSTPFGLVRVHKSFAVNLSRVERLTRTEAQLGDRRVPVGRRYRPAFVEAWQRRAARFDAP